MPPVDAVRDQQPTEPLIAEALVAIEGFAAERFTGVLERAALKYGANGALHRVVAPLSQEIGVRWQHGLSTAAHEHFASSLIRDFLRRSVRGYPLGDDAPRALVATPAGQLHELGAVMAATVATNLGWRTVYLGASLPSAEIAGAALQNGVRVILLSVVYPGDDPNLAGELRQIRRLVPAAVPIVVGGRAAASYRSVLEEVGAWVPEDLQGLANCLERVRVGPVEGRSVG